MTRKPATVDESVPRYHNPLMTGETYKALVIALIEAHPEDLINIFTRVMLDRADLTITHPMSEESRLLEGDITIPRYHSTDKERSFKLAIDEVL